MARAERMAGESDMSTEVGARATLNAPVSGGEQPAEENPITEEDTEAAVAAAESIVRSANVSPATPRGRLMDLFQRQPGTQEVRPTEQQAAVPPGREPPDGNRGGNDGRGGDNEGPEGPRGVEPTSGPEWETSPERGRWLAEEITRMETELPYDVRWNAENGPKLYELCKRLIAFVEKTEQKDRYSEDRFDAEKEHKVTKQPGKPLIETIIEAYEARIQRGVEQAGQEMQATPEDFTGVDSLRDLINKYNNLASEDDDIRAAVIAELPQIQEGLLKYFREANRKGLLKGVDEILNSIYLAFRRGRISSDQARAYTDQRITPSDQNRRPEAYTAAEAKFISRIENDPEVARLFRVWEPYLRWARSRLELTFDGEYWEPLEGEWRLPTERDEGGRRETYWHPYGGYPDYYEITAKTPREFIIAKETFLQMLKNRALGYDPNELMTNLLNFKKKYSAEATRLAEEQIDLPDGPDKMTVEFATESRQEFEGRAFLWHSFYNIQTYNKDGAKQGEMAMALHEGPQRWTRTLRSGEEGGVGFHTFSFDNLAMIEFALNAQGSRGQFGDRTQVQEYIRKTIYEIQTEKGMGILLKDYDWRDTDTYSDAELRLRRAQWIEQIEEHLRRNDYDLESLTEEDRGYYLQATAHPRTNQGKIGIHQSAEALKALYEGFENGDAHRNNYQEYVVKRKLDPKKFPKRLQDSVRIGMVQVAMDTIREEVRNGQAILRKGDSLTDKAINRLVEQGLIETKEKRLYKMVYEDAYAKSEASFEVAMQMQGVTHETTIRGSGIYFVHRNKYVREYKEFRRKFTRKANDPDISEWSLAERKKQFSRNQHLGWILDEIKKGASLDSFPQEEQDLYNGLSLQDKENYTDQIPAHLAQKAGMAVVNWVRMKYRDDADIWKQPGFTERVRTEPNFRARYRSAMVQKALGRAADAITEKGFEARFADADYAADYLDYFDKDGNLKPDKIEPQPFSLHPMTFKRPHVFGHSKNGLPIIAFDENGPVFGFDREGKRVTLSESGLDLRGRPIVYDKSGKPRDLASLVLEHVENNPGLVLTERDDGEGNKSSVYVESVDLDIQAAADSYLALHTAHTYWAYQSNNTHTLLPEYVFEQARQIRDGVLRMEDADIFAGLLLTLDPTLCRVKGFPGEQMTLEGIVFDAAVEESLLGFVDVKNVFKDRFLPKDGNKEHMDTGYYTEDLGGEFRFSLQIEALTAKMPDRWARRFRAAIAAAPMYADTMAGNLGRKGVMGAVSMMDDKIHELTTQRILSQFGVTKFINLMDSSTALWFALIGGTDPKTGLHHEGLFMKPTNNADKLVQLRDKLQYSMQQPNVENEYFYALMESFGRVWDTLKVIRTMYSDQRNAGGALDLRKADVFLPNGRFNPAIALEKERNTGTSRHVAKIFWDAYVDWLLDPGPGGGVAAYGSEAEFYKFLKEPYFYFKVAEGGEMIEESAGKLRPAKAGEKIRWEDGRTWAGWLFDKMAL